MNRREALKSFGGGAALTLTGAVIVAMSCVPTEVPAAEAAVDPMLEVLRWHRHHEEAFAKMAFSDDDEATDRYRAETLDVIEKLVIDDKPRVTTDEGARMALRTALTDGVFIAPFTHTLVLQTLYYLEGKAS